MWCEYCGEEIGDGSRFCAYCGKSTNGSSIVLWENPPLSTEVTDKDVADGVEDEYGVVYSHDGKRLLKCRNEELTQYIVKEGTKVICNRAFCGCSLTTIELPEGLEEIGMVAFAGCKKLTSIELPKGVQSIWNCAFWLCEKLTEIKLSNGLTLIGNLAFQDCESLTSVELPEGLTTIGNNAFAGCKNLTSIDLPEGLTSIRRGAFEGCEKLISIVLPKSLEILLGNPFTRCYAEITNKSPLFKVENGLLIKGTGVIAAIGNPKSIIVPDYITTIGNDAFAFCENLKTIELPKWLTHIGRNAFDHCEKLESIELPERLAYIGIDAFAACESLTSIELSDSISIELPDEGCFGGRAFGGCKNLKKVYIRCLCYSDGYYAIDKFRKYLSYELHDKIEIKVVDEFGVMYSTDGERLLKSTNCDLGFYIVRKWTKVICDKAFEGCKSLTSIELPEGLQEIGKDAFEKCDNLERINISCLYKADEAAVIEKFKKLLPERLHDKIEIVRW